MSKESAYAMPCPGCGRMFAFPLYHEDHCSKVLANQPMPEKRRRRRRRKKSAE